MEEVGASLFSLRYRALITFVSNEYGTEYMHLFTAEYGGEKLKEECDEGVIRWVKKRDIKNLPLWEGDKIFLSLLDTRDDFFSLKLVYSGDKLISHTIES